MTSRSQRHGIALPKLEEMPGYRGRPTTAEKLAANEEVARRRTVWTAGVVAAGMLLLAVAAIWYINGAPEDTGREVRQEFETAEPRAPVSSVVNNVVERAKTVFDPRSTEAFQQITRDARRDFDAGILRSRLDDSAYRGASIASELNVSLFSAYARQMAMLNGGDVEAVDALVRKASRDHELAMLGETSAIRAMYKHDEAGMAMLAVLSTVWSRDAEANARLERSCKLAIGNVARESAMDDSAPRQVMRFNASMSRVLADMAAARNVDVADSVDNTRRAVARSDSAWQIADLEAELQARILLAILSESEPAQAASIEQRMELADVGETSALRSLAEKKRTISRVLITMIESA